MPTVKTWKIRPAFSFLLEILNKKGDMTDDDLYSQLKEDYDDLGYKDFNDILMRLEVSGKIRTTSMSRGKRRVELIQ
ncbi:MAG: hypothetical protein NWE84_00575 [Candidatus Bathyarchaeota archaeon]|nr:hypothetical protein [Candidatus Bathyarchaeota archaeon]